MFLGTVPQRCIAQLMGAFPIGDWKEIYICCSGAFTIEKAFKSKFPDLIVHSNDVSVFSAALGSALAKSPIRLRFKGALAFIEEHMPPDDHLSRVASVILASDMTRVAAGNNSPYKDRLFDYHRSTFAGRLVATRAKLAALCEQIEVASYSSRDWRAHVDEAIDKGVAIAAFPPFFKGDYEKMFEFLAENIDWDSPYYPLYDPSELPSIVARIAKAGVPYCLLSDQVLERPAPILKYVQGLKVPHYCYGTAERASYRTVGPNVEPFQYRAPRLLDLGAETPLVVRPIASTRANFIKEIYLAKSIVFTDRGLVQLGIYLGDALAGIISYAQVTTGKGEWRRHQVYLMSDVSTSREAKISKLVARVALSRDVLRMVETRWLIRIDRVLTTARGRTPVSMKYRNIYKLHSRAQNENGGYVLNYIGDRLGETPQQIYEWWWRRYGERAVAEARSRVAQDRSSDAEAA